MAPNGDPHALGELLRERRARLHPADVGLPAGRRRRTAGLRREEVAQLASMSVTYYTFLEQGRPVRPSAQVVDALATALRFSPAERDYLRVLAHGMRTGEARTGEAPTGKARTGRRPPAGTRRPLNAPNGSIRGSRTWCSAWSRTRRS